MDNYQRFLTTWSGKRLLEQHKLEEYGFWKISGEDPNCDMGGSHVSPFLGVVEGKLEDVIRYAVELPNFWQWGSGGNIESVSAPLKIDGSSAAKRKAMMERKAALEEELKQINSELNIK